MFLLPSMLDKGAVALGPLNLLWFAACSSFICSSPNARCWMVEALGSNDWRTAVQHGWTALLTQHAMLRGFFSFP